MNAGLYQLARYRTTSPEINASLASLTISMYSADPNLADPVSKSLGYLVSQYPTVNHTFILREIVGLRKLGWSIEVVSIARPDRAVENMTETEGAEAKKSFSLFGAPKRDLAALCFRCLLERPLALVGGLVHALRLGSSNPLKIPRYLAYWVEALCAGQYFVERHVDHVHSHFSSTVLLLMERMFPLTVSMTIHGPDEFNDVAGFHLARKVSVCSMVVAISNYAASQVMRSSNPEDWKKIKICRLGVHLDEYTPRSKSPGSQVEIVMVGRLAPAKAQLVLVEMAALLKTDTRFSFRLRLVGEGPDRPRLEQRIAELNLTDTVELTGALHHNKVREIYAGSDLFVLASFAEGVPVVLMEAMAMEIPCVATWITGIPELIENNKEGWLVPPASPQALAQTVGAILNDPRECALRGKAARDRILADYNLANNIPALSNLFVEIKTGRVRKDPSFLTRQV
jgi:colanic acid/amylovoran biosynthesis glycosyltransferase